MNIILFHPEELQKPLPLTDRRAQHILQVLKKKKDDSCKAGIINESVGQLIISNVTAENLHVKYQAQSPALPLNPIILLLGFPRPIQARRVFKDLATLGIEKIMLTGTDLGEKSYRESNFFKHEEYQNYLAEGAEQAGNSMIPRVDRFWSLEKALETLRLQKSGARLLLHPDTKTVKLGSVAVKLDRDREKVQSDTLHSPPYMISTTHPLILAIGSERGWTDVEFNKLTLAGFLPVSLGDRILKTETACIAAVSILLSKMGVM